MKIRYIKEGYFNNPDQMKAKAERGKNVSSVDKLASTAENLINYPVKQFVYDNLNTNFIRKNFINFVARYSNSLAEINDFFIISPFFFTGWCFADPEEETDTFIRKWSYKYEQLYVKDLNMQEKTMTLVAEIGTPEELYISDTKKNEIYIVGDLVALAQACGEGLGPKWKKHRLISETLPTLFGDRHDDAIGDTFKKYYAGNQSIMNTIDLISKELQITVEVVMNLDKDIIICPICMCDDFWVTASRKYNDLSAVSEYYDFKRYGHKTNIEELKSKMKSGSYRYNTLERHIKNMSDVVNMMREYLKEYVTISTNHHIYLSLGGRIKDYLLI